MKKLYRAPEAEIEIFTLSDIITNSNDPIPGWEDGDEEIEF